MDDGQSSGSPQPKITGQDILKMLQRATFLAVSAKRLIPESPFAGEPAKLQESDAMLYEAMQCLVSVPEEISSELDDFQDLMRMILHVRRGIPELMYFKTADLRDLAESIARGEALANIESHDRALILSTTGVNHWRVYKRTYSLSNLQFAVTRTRQSLDLTPFDDRARPARLITLGAILYSRYNRLSKLTDLNEAISTARGAIDLFAGQPEKAQAQSDLAVYLSSRARKTGALEDFDLAIETAKESLQATPHVYPDRMIRLHNLGSVYLERYRTTKLVDDLDHGIQVAWSAVYETSTDASENGNCLFQLGELLHYKYQMTGSSIDRDLALNSCKGAFDSRGALPWVRIQSARHLCPLLIDSREWTSAAQIAEEAINLSNSISPRWISFEDHVYNLRVLWGLPTVAASFVLQSGGDASHAISLLERGRGVLSSLVLSFRSDITDLHNTHPELAAKYSSLRDELSHPPSTTMATSLEILDPTFQGNFLERTRLLEMIEETEKEIRMMHGFETFHSLPSPESLMELANNGPVVAFIPSLVRCDAIAITSRRIDLIELPSLEYHRLTAIATKYKSLFQSSSRRRTETNSKLGELMAWVWDVAVQPVLEHLDLLRSPSDNEKDSTKPLPRVWWLVTGVMSYIPVHAAGYHTPGSTENTISHVVSSYVLTLRSFKYFRERETPSQLQDTPANKNKMVVVEMPQTPGMRDLNTQEETAAIRQHAGKVAQVEVLTSPTRKDVLKALQNCSVIHFACHAVTDTLYPPKSRLLLSGDEGKEVAQDAIDVRDLSQLSNTSAQLAYLSACSTTQNRNTRFLDENITLASMLHSTGFSNVIGTSWKVVDANAVDVAAQFYSHLFREGEDVLIRNHDAVAFALHHAVCLIRSEDPGSILDWAPFVHFGP